MNVLHCARAPEYGAAQESKELLVTFCGGSVDGKVLTWPGSMPLPTWVRTGPGAEDYYRIDEGSGALRYRHVSLLMVSPRADVRQAIPTEVRQRACVICEDSIGKFPIVTREKPSSDRRFELWIGDRLVGYFPTRELAERTGRRMLYGHRRLHPL